MSKTAGQKTRKENGPCRGNVLCKFKNAEIENWRGEERHLHRNILNSPLQRDAPNLW